MKTGVRRGWAAVAALLAAGVSDVVQGALKVYDWPQLCLRVNEG